MKDELRAFQKRAVASIRKHLDSAIKARTNGDDFPHIVSFTAPTGAGKTLMAASVMEEVYMGGDFVNERTGNIDTFLPMPEAIFLWLSDSPELNEQSKDKIERRADRIRPGQCIIIDDDSFKDDIFADGHIYFLNTQKLSVSSRLTSVSDTRPHTIWEAIRNTAERKGEHFIVIIDEAHRGAQGKEAGRATTIMQKFIKGSDEIPPMPIVIGMSATIDRFNALLGDTLSTLHRVNVNPTDVIESGLLKDRIILKYPDDDEVDRKMAVLQAGAEKWRDKCDHWSNYCRIEHAASINPILIVQVENGSGSVLTATDLSACIQKIESAANTRFNPGEVVHAFGGTNAPITAAGLEIPYLEPSRINDDMRVRVVFFKESLSTGWDCPRAETMVSFRHASDFTYVAQLLGRIVRTPAKSRIRNDDSLNEVHIFLPFFDKDTVSAVVDRLYSSENGALPKDIDIYGESTSNDSVYRTASVKRREDGPELLLVIPGLDSDDAADVTPEDVDNAPVVNVVPEGGISQVSSHQHENPSQTHPASPATSSNGTHNEDIVHHAARSISEMKRNQRRKTVKYKRDEIIKAINDLNLVTYEVRTAKVRKGVDSLLDISGFLSRQEIYKTAPEDMKDKLIQPIKTYADSLRADGSYDELSKRIRSFKLNTRTFDSFGKAISEEKSESVFSSDSDADLDRKFRIACTHIGGTNLGAWYGQRYYDENEPASFQIDVILFTASEANVTALNKLADDLFYDLDRRFRSVVGHTCNEIANKEYNRIVSDSDKVTPHAFRLPAEFEYRASSEGEYDSTHLYVDAATNSIRLKLNDWEKAVLEEEKKHPDFMCWIRNLPRNRQWNFCVPYLMNRDYHGSYPDIIVIRHDDITGISIHVLEPHSTDFNDSLYKAQGFAKYAHEYPIVSRFEMIRLDKNQVTGKKEMMRLDVTDLRVRQRLEIIDTAEAFESLFDEFGKKADWI